MRVMTKLATGLTLLAAFAVGASAQISLSSAVDLALRSDPRVKMSRASVDKAQAALRETYDAYIPSAVADLGYGKGVGVPTSLPVVFSLSAQSLAYNFSQHDNIRSASAGLQAAKLALQDSRDQVAEDVTVTYLNLDNAQRRQATSIQESGFATRLVTIVQERLSAGQDTEIDLLHARRSAKEIELQQLQTDDEVTALSDHLARLIGLPGSSITTVPDSIPAFPPIQPLTGNGSMSVGVRSAFTLAKSKQEYAFGENRYRLRPQFSLGMNYTRIDTGQNDYTTYYPNFLHTSENAESIYISVQIPIFDRRHQDEARQASADAAHAYFEAQNDRNQFLDGRLKLQHSAAELSARSDLAEIDRDLAQQQLNAVLAQLTSGSANNEGPQMTPKDEQTARLEESARTIDLLNAQFQLSQAEVNLMRQTGQLDSWLKIATGANNITAAPVTR
jgi:outer membrane protein TolC